MREIRRNTEGEDNNQQKPKEPAPGESKQNPGHKDGGSRVDPPQQSVTPTITDPTDLLESSLTFPVLKSQALKSQKGPAHFCGSYTEIRERSTKWTA
jgi:hypothetical protein